MGKYTISILLIIAIEALSVGCRKNASPLRGPSHDEVLSSAYSLIDQGRESEAIDQLEEHHRNYKTLSFYPIDQGERDETQLAIASAYASLAGLRIHQYLDFFREVFNGFHHESNEVEELVIDLIDLLHTERSDVGYEFIEKKVKPVIESFFVLRSYKKKIDFLPRLSEKQLKDLEKAREAMAQIRKVDSGRALFRATLQLTQLRNQFFSKEVPATLPQSYDWGRRCALQIAALKTEVSGFSSLVESILRDLSVAYPSQKTEFSQQRGELKQLMGDVLQQLENVAQFLQENALLMKTLFKAGFSEPQCEGIGL